MPDTIHRELDPLFETVGLMSVSRNTDETRRETVKALDELGFDGEKFYAAQMAVFDDYVAEFRKHRKACEADDLFFGESGGGLLILFMCLLLENRETIVSESVKQDGEIIAGIVEMCRALFDVNLQSAEGPEGMMAFVDACPLTESEKWKLLRIMRKPSESVQLLVDSINANISAFEKAKKKVRAPLDKLITQYTGAAADDNGGILRKFKDSLPEPVDIFPSLAFPVSQMMFSNTCYYGLMSTLLVKPEGPDNELLLRRLKALSDASRLEIMRSLRAKPKYNLEIAEQLGLTAATMSHHMGVLLTCGFVGVTKQDSRVYYHLEEDGMRQFIASLEQMLT